MPAQVTRLYRFVFGIGVFLTLGIQFYVSCIQSTFSPISFFSFFTVISNILGGTLLLCLFLSHKKKQTLPFESFRGAVTVYMAVTGIVYWGILHRFLDGSIEWINLYAHGVMPIVILADWLLNPPKNFIPYKSIYTWILFPLLFVIYTEFRGYFVSWYPYPFLTPSVTFGYRDVILYSVGILLLITVLSFLLISWGNKFNRSTKRRQ